MNAPCCLSRRAPGRLARCRAAQRNVGRVEARYEYAIKAVFEQVDLADYMASTLLDEFSRIEGVGDDRSGPQRAQHVLLGGGSGHGDNLVACGDELRQQLYAERP